MKSEKRCIVELFLGAIDDKRKSGIQRGVVRDGTATQITNRTVIYIVADRYYD